MKINIRTGLPFITLGAGGLSLCLQLWLFSREDELGLLPKAHFSGSLCLILFAVFLVFLFLVSRKFPPMSKYTSLFPADVFGALGCVAGAVGIATTLFSGFNGMIMLMIVCILTGGAAMGALLYTGYCRFVGEKPSYLFHSALIVSLMLQMINACRVWGAQPQAQLYFFPMLAHIFLLLTAYHRATLDYGKHQRQWAVLFLFIFITLLLFFN